MESQRLILFFVFSFSVFLLLDAWQRDQPPAQPAPAVRDKTEKAAQPAAPAPVPSEKLAATPDSVPQHPQRLPEPGRTIRVETDLLVAHIGTQGGDLRRLELKKHRDTLDRNKTFVLLEATPERTYIAQSGLTGGKLPSHRTAFTAERESYQLAGGAGQLEVRLRAPEADGVQVTKIYRFHRGSYLADVAFEIRNQGAATMQPYAYFQLVRDGKPPAGDSAMMPTFTGIAVYTDKDKFQKITFEEIDKGKASYPKNANDGWIAVIQHYFFGAWLPKNGTPREFYTQRLDGGFYSVGVIVPVGAIAPGAAGSVTVPLYAGPQEQEKLARIAPGLDLTIDYGWLTIIAVPLFWLLEWLNRWVGNWGVAIILL
ncbi:MAG: membrane protein insertase YidC, partial [Betaproteobacteria bacterium]|nr:membrane protein insertase YidC [Betaproteobacteria bacterium]